MGQYAMTGGATGIGAAIKQQLLADGHSVVVIDIKDADIEADLSTPDGRKNAAKALREACSAGLDGLITCAGVAGSVPNHRLIASVNYHGTVELIEAARELLAKKRGSVVLVSSNSAPMETNLDYVEQLLNDDTEAAMTTAETMTGHMVYSGSKQAVARWMRRNTASYAGQGIRMNAIAPGYTQTPMTEQVEKDPKMGPAIRKFMESIPIGRPGKPEDMAAATKFLLSDAASFVCGSVLFIDGGHDASLRPDQF